MYALAPETAMCWNNCSFVKQALATERSRNEEKTQPLPFSFIMVCAYLKS
jgi:hypothetical protein